MEILHSPSRLLCILLTRGEEGVSGEPTNEHYTPRNMKKDSGKYSDILLYALLFCCFFNLKSFLASTVCSWMGEEHYCIKYTGMNSFACVGNWCSFESTLVSIFYDFGLQTCNLQTNFTIFF